MARKLRIAVSVFFGLVTVALCVLWVRSYWRIDHLTFPLLVKQGVLAESFFGKTLWHRSDGLDSVDWQLVTETTGPDDWEQSHRIFNWTRLPYSRPLKVAWAVPYWAIVMPVMMAAALPWAGLRFSLRTMLIATTLVAVVLGLGVWLAS